MDAINLFDAHGYFQALCTKNKLAQVHGFFPCSCSGINSLEEVVDNFKTQSAFLFVDDTNDGVTEQRSGCFFKTLTFTVFLLKNYTFGDMTERQEALDICRQLFRQLHSRLLIDVDDLECEQIYMNTDRVYSREIGQYFMAGSTGLYFMVDVSEPTDLTYNSDEWA